MKSPLSPDILFHVGPLAITQQVVATWVLIAFLGIGSALATRRLRVDQPGRLQVLLEAFIETVQGQIKDTMRCDPARFLPLIATLFLFILCANLSTLIPGNEPPTASIETDAVLALLVFFSVIRHGVRSHGVLGYLRSFARPSWVMIPLNLLEHLTRTVALMVRLFGNIMSGAFVIAVVLSLAGLFVPIPFMALEVLTGIIQAYIFSVLAMVFIGAAVREES
jgi:F-type H+-transporting ATPase subunit a